MHTLLLGLEKLRIGGLGPEIDDHAHGLQELLGEWRAAREAWIIQYHLGAGITAKRPPFFLYVAAGKPFDVLQRLTLVLRIGHDRNALPPELRRVRRRCRIDEETDLLAANIRVLIETWEEGEEVHLQSDLTRFEGIESLRHVGIGITRRRAALVELFIGFEPLHRTGRIDEAVHRIRLVRVLIFEAVVVKIVRDTHGDAFRTAFGVDSGTINLFAIDIAALEELRDIAELIERFRHTEIATVLGREILLHVRPREPVL